jgi:hypothetical protein
MKKETGCGSSEIFVVGRAWTMAWRNFLSFGNEMLFDALNLVNFKEVFEVVR